MLPLLPALILLLLQGPSNFERLALHGRFPTGLDRIQREVNLPEGRERTEVLARLLAAAGAIELSQALLSMGDPAPVVWPAKETVAPVLAHAEADAAPPEGFLRSQRSRDGPVQA